MKRNKFIFTVILLMSGLFFCFVQASTSYHVDGTVIKTTKLHLSQTSSKTSLLFGDKIIKTWSHTSTKNPFVYDEGCSALTKIFDSIQKKSGSITPEQKQKGWEKLGKKKQMLCIKENLAKSVKWKKIQGDFYEITQSFYEGSEAWLFDIKNNILVAGFGLGIIKNIYLMDELAGFVMEQPLGDSGDTVIIYSKKEKKIIKNWNQEGTEEISVMNLSLVNSGSVKITFKKGISSDGSDSLESITLKLN